MSRQTPVEDREIELRLVLVDKSFKSVNGDINLSLVTVKAKPSQKISALKTTLRQFGERIVLSLYYRGVRCEPTREVDYYRGLGNDGLWQARLMEKISATESKIALDIMKGEKKTVLMLPSTISILSFKDILHHRLGFPPEDQHLLLNNKAVRKSARLRDCAKTVKTNMVLMHEPSADQDITTKTVEFSRHLIEPIHRDKRNEESKHREIVSGLNIEGICVTPSCQLFGQNAIYALGQEVFDMCVDAAFCPLCNNEMHITNAGFHDCAWRILGVKKNGEHKLNVKTIARQTGDEYVRCDPSKCRTPGKWLRLMLQAVPVKCAKQCVVCRSRIDSDEYLTSLCGEYIHHNCYVAWKKLDSRCPSCLQQLQT